MIMLPQFIMTKKEGGRKYTMAMVHTPATHTTHYHTSSPG